MDLEDRTIVTTSWDDGDPLDLKLADLLAEHGVAGTFYVSPRNRERPAMGPGEVRQLGEGFEVGAHTLTHPDLRVLTPDEAEREISAGKRELEDVVGRPVEMFCYPRGRHNAAVRGRVIESGFIGARTTRVCALGPPRDPWLMPTTVCARPRRPLTALRRCLRACDGVGLRQLIRLGARRPWPELACRFFEEVRRRGGVWHLWGHSWEIEQAGLWGPLREVLRHVAGRPDVLYLTNADVIGRAE